MRSLDKYLQDAAKARDGAKDGATDGSKDAAKGGTVRSGIILGIRMATVGLTRLRIDKPQDHRRLLITIVETDRCLPDAVELVTGCRLGNRTLQFKDLGKMAATFVDLKTRNAVRVAARESANRRAVEMAPRSEREAALCRAYRMLPDEELFSQQSVRVALTREEIPGYWSPRAICDECEEGISFGKQVIQNNRTLCRSCAGPSYFQPMPAPSPFFVTAPRALASGGRQHHFA